MKILNVAALVVGLFLATPAMGVIVDLDLTADGLGIASGNLGPVYIVGGVLEISAQTHIVGQTFETGSIYLDGNHGIGVQTLAGKGSKGISGRGGDQDEALIFLLNPSYQALGVELNKYKAKKDEPVITLFFASGNSLVFTECNWGGAAISVGKGKVKINFSPLVPQTEELAGFSVMEVEGHTYVDAITYDSQVPEPVTCVLLGFGAICAFCRPSRRGRN